MSHCCFKQFFSMQIKYLDGVFYSYIISKLIKCLTKNGITEFFEIYFYLLLKVIKNKLKIQNCLFLIFELFELNRPIIGLKRLTATTNIKTIQNQ